MSPKHFGMSPKQFGTSPKRSKWRLRCLVAYCFRWISVLSVHREYLSEFSKNSRSVQINEAKSIPNWSGAKLYALEGYLRFNFNHGESPRATQWKRIIPNRARIEGFDSELIPNSVNRLSSDSFHWGGAQFREQVLERDRIRKPVWDQLASSLDALDASLLAESCLKLKWSSKVIPNLKLKSVRTERHRRHKRHSELRIAISYGHTNLSGYFPREEIALFFNARENLRSIYWFGF